MLRVGLFLPAGWWCQRELLDGVTSFLDELPHDERWECFNSPEVPTPEYLERTYDGALARMYSDQHAELIQSIASHVVGVMSHNCQQVNLPHVTCDDRAIGAAGAQELIQRGYRDVAFATLDKESYSRLRCEGFADAAKKAGVHLHLRPDNRPLIDWLVSLPKPIGVLGSNDDMGKRVLDACRTAGIRVPADLAVMGVDNDPQLCELSWPPLASINAGHFEVGRRAAQRLHAIMRGEKSFDAAPRIESVGLPEVIVRVSVDGMAVDDKIVREALQFIASRAHEPIGVDDICSAVSTSRRSMEIRFRAATGRTILQELHRARVQVARRLLATRRLSVDEVATLAGFSNQTRLGVVFRQVTGMTPTAYRRRALGINSE